jgi:hypothetical protein
VAGYAAPFSRHWVTVRFTSAGFADASPGPGSTVRARRAGRLVTAEHQPKTSSHAAAAAIASTSTVRFPSPTGRGVIHRSGVRATAIRLLARNPG